MPARPLIEHQSQASAQAIAITIPVRLVGIVLLGFVAAMMAALASWSVDDPSLSYAATKPIQNWLGYPGAVMAAMQRYASSAAPVSLGVGASVPALR